MSIRIVIMFICAAIGTAAGYAIMRTYRRNLAYLEDMCNLVNELKRNISYRKDSATAVLGAFGAESAQLKKNIEEYIKFASEKDGKLEISRGTLQKTTYASVCGFFSSLGLYDGAAQLGELEMYGSGFCDLKKAAAEKSEKYGPLAVKLGFLFGLCAGVLFL